MSGKFSGSLIPSTAELMSKLPPLSKGCLLALVPFNQSILAPCSTFLLASYVELIIKQFSTFFLSFFFVLETMLSTRISPRHVMTNFFLVVYFFFLSLLFVGNTSFLASFLHFFLSFFLCIYVCDVHAVCMHFHVCECMCVHTIWSQRLASGVLLDYSLL